MQRRPLAPPARHAGRLRRLSPALLWTLCTPTFAAAAPHDVPWTVLQPVQLTSAGGATLTAQPDGAITASGKSPDKDVYHLEFETDLPRITGLRLEALADPALPHSGPGRAGNGNFVLNEIKVEATTKLQRRFRRVPLEAASTDFIEKGRWPEQVCDGIEHAGGNGWAVDGAAGHDHQCVVALHEPFEFDGPGPGLVAVDLVFEWGSQHTLGRLRLSATGAARPFSVRGAGDDGWAAMQQRINQAIDRGIDWLLDQQQLDGSWNHEQWTYRCGATALATYALLKSHVGAKHPAVVRALEFLRGQPARETYSIGCELMALAALGDPANDGWMKELSDRLLSMPRNGLFNYPWGNPDLSNTQYGVLGLRAAAQRGIKVPNEFWDKAAKSVIGLSAEDGSGAYAPLSFRYNVGAKPTGSMTAAGAGILAICDEQLNGSGKGGSLRALALRGADWIGAHWQTQKNPLETHDRWDIYYLYGVERVGSLLKVETVGPHRWYREGAIALVEMQHEKGEWSSAYSDQVINTCFALLFLNKATAVASGVHAVRAKIWGGDDPKKPLSLRASGDTPLTMWISRIGERELAANEWPREDGRGLRVRRVEYVAKGLKDQPGEVVLAGVDADPAKPCGKERFAAQYSFLLPGRYRIFARMTVAAPPAPVRDLSAAAAAPPAPPPADVTLCSDPVEVRIDEATDPELLQYARDPALNLLSGQKVAASASSEINGDWHAGFACDGLQCRGWACKDGDAAPTLSIELEKPVRAARLLLTPAKIGDDFGARITKVAVTLNGRGPPLEAEAPAGGERRKVRVEFPRAQIIRRLEVRVTGVDANGSKHDAVGFAEVELQVDKPGQKGGP